jgi:hypothetical protein
MLRIDARRPVHFCDGTTRRDFIHAGSLGMLGLSLPALQAMEARGDIDRTQDMNCILLFQVGGPSQLDTWDPKPDAPKSVSVHLSLAWSTSGPGLQVDAQPLGDPYCAVPPDARVESRGVKRGRT